jgi:uncharacterized protein (DUF1499 family)
MKTNIIHLFCLGFLLGCNGEKAKELGVFQDGLNVCPPSSKCVSSSHPKDQAEYSIDALQVEGDYINAIEKLLKITRKNPQFKLSTLNPTYLQYEHTSGLFNTIRDVEFFYTPAQNVIHIRAQSRSHLPDFGGCRNVLEDIKFKYFQNDVN